MRAIAAYDSVGDKQTRLALQLLALAFVRTNELIGAMWSEFDLKNALWVIPAERMKMRTEHIVPLARQALELLTELKKYLAIVDLFFQAATRANQSAITSMLFALYRLGYKGKMTGMVFVQ